MSDETSAAKDRLLAPLPQAEPRFHYSAFHIGMDSRSEAGFRQQVDEYISKAHRCWRTRITQAAIARGLGRVRLAIVNPTDQNFEGVEVVLELPDLAPAYLSSDDVIEAYDPPEPPRPWGTFGTFAADYVHLLPSVPGDLDDRVERGDRAQTVRFAPRHVRPHEHLMLAPVHLGLGPRLAGQDLTLRWRLTSVSADGRREGSITLAVASEPMTVQVPAES